MRKLLVITEELPIEIAQAGADPTRKAAYYNPAGCFDEVALIDWGRGGTWPELGHRSLVMPREPELEAWLSAVQAADFLPVMGDELASGWPGVPGSWLEIAREFGPDAIRAYGLRWSGWLALELGDALGVPVLCSAHNVIGLASPVLKRAPCTMAVSDEVARACIADGADPARVVTVHNRVDRECFSPSGPPADGPEGSPKLLCIARDVEQKNLDRMLEACSQLKEDLPDLRLVHIGASTRDWSAHSFVTHYRSVPNSEIPTWLRWADALLLPSLWEGFGIVIVEALACGTPVLTSNRLPMSELVIHNWDGLLFDPEDVGAISNAIRKLADPETAARLAAPARAASEPFSEQVISRRESRLYNWLLGAERPQVSVVLPTYNRAEWLARAVPNTLDQEYAKLELVVVNDGSTDTTAEVLPKHATNPRLVVHEQENRGLSRAINAGAAASGGELLTWKADDDFYAPGAIEALARELYLDPGADMVFTDYRARQPDGSLRTVETGPVQALSERNVVGLCFLFRRELFERVGGVNPEYHLAEDYELWVRMSNVGRLKRLPRVLYEVTEHDATLTRSRYADALAMTWNVQREHFPAEQSEAAKARQLGNLASAYKAQGMPLKSLKAGLRLARVRPLAGTWAVLRSLTPMPILRATRRLRGQAQ